MGVTLWSKDGYFLDAASVALPPLVAVNDTLFYCSHEIRNIIASNNRRVEGTYLCCSRITFCHVCLKFIINSGVSVIFLLSCSLKNFTAEHKEVVGKIPRDTPTPQERLLNRGSLFEAINDLLPKVEHKQYLNEALLMLAASHCRLSIETIENWEIVNKLPNLIQLYKNIKFTPLNGKLYFI